MIIILVFAIGWVSNSLYTEAASSEIPFGDFSKDKPSPKDWITKDKIHVYEDKIIIDIQGAEWAEFEDTNSMDPIIDSSANSIELKPKDSTQLQMGDIVSYKSTYSDGIIIHRIIEIGHDNDGWYAIMKGDNNSRQDPGKVRFDQIQGVLVGILY